MTTLTPAEAAETIRESFNATLGTVGHDLDPAERHRQNFERAVAKELGYDEPSDFILMHVRHSLEEHDVEHEEKVYPRAVTREATAEDVANKAARYEGELIPVLDEQGHPVIEEGPEDEKQKTGGPKSPL